MSVATEERTIHRIIYARKPGDKNEEFTVENGEPITVELATDLKNVCWGGADRPLKPIWLKQGLGFHAPEKLFAYGLKMPKNETKNFLMCIQAYLLRHLLFQVGSEKDKKAAANRRYNKKGGKDEKLTDEAIAKKLKPKQATQVEMMVEGLVEMLFKASGGKDAVFCLPGEKVCFEAPSTFLNDNVTEKLRIFTTKTPGDMKAIIKVFLPELSKENGFGVISVLYSLILSKTPEQILENLQDKASTPLIDLAIGECTPALLNLAICGQATPYVHNSTLPLDDGTEITGICGRNDIGLLIASGNIQSDQVGAYLKTPTLPMWMTKCDNQMGILFNPNKDLLRTPGAENKFNLFYYANYEFTKTDTPKETMLTIDSRNKVAEETDKDFDQTAEKVTPLLETAIHTKWEAATIDWNGIEPYIW